MVVACLVAGVGAWGAKVSVTYADNTYASELFGAGHAAIEYPEGREPKVVLTIPANHGVLAEAGDCPEVPARNHDGSAEITFSLVSGEFAANVTGLLYDPDGPATSSADKPATGDIASIVSGGREGDKSITIKVEPAGGDGRRDTSSATRNSTTCVISGAHAISFELPRLAKLEGLAGANSQDDKTDNDFKYVWLNATSRIVSGAFTDGPLVPAVSPGFYATQVMRSRDAVTVEVNGHKTRSVAISDDAGKGLTAFKSVKEKNKDGYVELATVTVMTVQEMTPKKDPVNAMHMYDVLGPSADTLANRIFSRAQPGGSSVPWDLYDLSGDKIDAGLRGTLTVDASGTRDLFNDGDMLFIDYDGNGMMGDSEMIAIDGSEAMGEALSIDSSKSESFDGGTGTFKVYYMPGGKDSINHGAMINLAAMVNYSDPSAIDETPRTSSTTLNFDGVGNPVRAYAIPHSTNGTGDKANVRVRCEEPAPGAEACRVFLECWDDMGMRSFGEAPMIAGNSLTRWTSADIEGVTGMEPTSRHSCRVLSKGMVTVQQLTRDGNSGTLVNNTYVGGGM